MEVASPVVAVAFPTESPKNLVHNIPDMDAHWSIIALHNGPKAMGYNARNEEIRDNIARTGKHNVVRWLLCAASTLRFPLKAMLVLV